MRKAVMLSIRPQLCELISAGIKTVEVRKTRPNLETPFKCYIYETKGLTDTPWMDEDGHICFQGRGKVIGEFVCTEIARYAREEIEEYGKGVPHYGWLIRNLRVYDEPKPLSAFKRWNRTEENVPCAHVRQLYEPCETCNSCNLTRPPKNWCYVED